MDFGYWTLGDKSSKYPEDYGSVSESLVDLTGAPYKKYLFTNTENPF